jgi:superfamily I DNA/RNA helicase
VAGIGPTFQTAIYDRARRDGVTFADALIASHAEGFPEAGGAVVGKARALMDAVIAWLDAHEPPEAPEATWGEWLREVFTDEAPAHIYDELDHLLGIADAEVEPDVSLDRYMGQIIVLAKDHAAASASGVRFMTMSMSKGLTVEASIVIAAERDVVPDPRGREAEERRLLYVAMTRARRFSYVTMAGRRTGPTARSGAGRVQERRNESPFLTHGPVQIEPGEDYIKRRWPPKGRRAGAA